MGIRTKYSPGTFSWIDLSTPAQDAAKDFYGALFGWEADDLPMGEGGVYSMMQQDGQTVAAITPQPQAQRDAGIPPVWNSYVTVESVDATLARAGELGGHVHAGPFDVFEAGRMGVVQDPQGAFFMPWEPRQKIGAGLVNAPGALCWNELHVPDLDAAETFYGELFGWSTEPVEGSPIPYRVIKNSEGHTNGGMTSMMAPGAPPSWLVYFGTERVDDVAARVGELGGSLLAEPMDLGEMGRIAVAADPQGGAFALYSGNFEE